MAQHRNVEEHPGAHLKETSYRREPNTPDDFPCNAELGWVSGAAVKFVARTEGGRYTSLMPAQELYERYLGCCDLLDDLVTYWLRKKREQPELEDSELYRRIDKGLLDSGHTGLTLPERQWVMKELEALMSRGCGAEHPS